MIAEIINALTQELKYFVKDNDGMVIFDTELQNDIAFSMPLIILECNETPDSARLPGNGITRMDWRFSVRIYNSEPDSYIDDDTTGSSIHINYSDLIRNYIENEKWATQLMVNLKTNYGLRFTYVGTSQAASLPTEDKTYKGYVHVFETISFDSTIASTTDMTIATQTTTGAISFE